MEAEPSGLSSGCTFEFEGAALRKGKLQLQCNQLGASNVPDAISQESEFAVLDTAHFAVLDTLWGVYITERVQLTCLKFRRSRTCCRSTRPPRP